MIYKYLFFTLAQVYNPNLPQVDTTNGSLLKLVISIVFGLIGAISLLILVIGGFRYTISRGEPQEVAKAKDTILYAAVGIIICVLAEVIVNFIITSV